MNIDVFSIGRVTKHVAVGNHGFLMDHATLRFFGELTDFLPSGQRTATVVVADSPSVKDRIEACGVPHTEVDLILVGGEPVDFGYQLQPGDWVSVYPVFRSLEIEGGLRPAPPDGRFVVDVNLGRLAKYLRLLGFDAVSDGALDDSDLAHISVSENRILLTKDRNLLKRSLIIHGYFVRSVWPPGQIVEVVRRFDLRDSFEPFARCMECNNRIEPVPKAEIEHLLEPLTKRHYDNFRRCTGCGRIFWRGSHHERLAEMVDEVRRLTRPEKGRAG